MACLLHQLHCIFVNALFAEGAAENLGEELRAVQGFLASAEDDRVTRLEAETCTVNRYVRTAFEDEEYGADRDCDAANLDAVLQVAALQDAVQWIGECCDFLGALGHGLDARVVQCEAVDHRIANFPGGGFNVELVGFKNGRLAFAEEACDAV